MRGVWLHGCWTGTIFGWGGAKAAVIHTKQYISNQENLSRQSINQP